MLPRSYGSLSLANACDEASGLDWFTGIFPHLEPPALAMRDRLHGHARQTPAGGGNPDRYGNMCGETRRRRAEYTPRLCPVRTYGVTAASGPFARPA